MINVSMKLMTGIPCSRRFRLSYLSYFRCLSSTYLHLRHAFWHLRRTRGDLLQCGISFMHFLVFQIFAHPARHVAQHFTFDHEVPHFPFIKIALHLRLGNTFLQTVGTGQAGQTPPQSIFSSSWFRMPSSQVSHPTHVVLSAKSKTTPADARDGDELTALLKAGTK